LVLLGIGRADVAHFIDLGQLVNHPTPASFVSTSASTAQAQASPGCA
jgi:hypothetical protein